MSGLAFHIAVLVTLFIVWLVVGLPLGSYRLRQADEAWAQRLSADRFQEQYPSREHSPAALQLDALVRPKGGPLALAPQDKGKSFSLLSKDEFTEFGNFLGALRRDRRDGPIRVPPQVARATETRADLIRRIEDLLMAADEIHWRTPTSFDEMTVSWLGLRHVQSLLLVNSVLADARGATPVRDRSLEATWRLEQSLWRRTDSVDQFIAFAIATDRNACLRRLRPPGGAWEGRLDPRRPLAALADTFQANAQAYCRGAQNLAGIQDLDYLTRSDRPAVGLGGWLFRVGTAPYVRLSVAGYSEGLRQEVERLKVSDPCALERESYEESVKGAQPSWNIFARVAMPSLVSAWLAGRDAALDDELTAAVLVARNPAGGPGERPSTVCPELVWITSRAGEGRMHVEAVGGLPELETGQAELAYAVSLR